MPSKTLSHQDTDLAVVAGTHDNKHWIVGLQLTDQATGQQTTYYATREQLQTLQATLDAHLTDTARVIL